MEWIAVTVLRGKEKSITYRTIKYILSSFHAHESIYKFTRGYAPIIVEIIQ